MEFSSERRRVEEMSHTSILVVDDDRDAGQNLGDILLDLGYDVDIATDPFVALQMSRERPYDIALLDLKMPGMDGLTLTANLKSSNCATIVILTTAYANEATLAAAQRQGIWKVFPKPLDLRLLLSSLETAPQLPLVMLVDDDEELCLSLSDLLHDQGYRVCFATDIERAIHCLRESHFHAALIDMRLPGGFGDELFQKFREMSHNLPVILATAYRHDMDERIRQSLQAGVNAVCYKPFELPALLNTLKQLTAPTEHPR